MAGTLAGVGNNGIGVAGIAHQSGILPIRISSLTGGATFSSMYQGTMWAADHGARVANISYENACLSASVQSGGDYLKSKGGLLFVAAGNTATDDTTSINSPSLICVSTDSNDTAIRN